MSSYPQMSHGSGHTTVSTTPCPLCSRPLRRTWRRPIDRLKNLVVPVQRFRCYHFECQWEGNLPAARKNFVSTKAQLAELQSPRKRRSTSSLTWSFVVSTSLALAGLIGVSALVVTDRPVSQQQAAAPDLSDYALSNAPKLETDQRRAELEVDLQRNSR